MTEQYSAASGRAVSDRAAECSKWQRRDVSAASYGPVLRSTGTKLVRIRLHMKRLLTLLFTVTLGQHKYYWMSPSCKTSGWKESISRDFSEGQKCSLISQIWFPKSVPWSVVVSSVPRHWMSRTSKSETWIFCAFCFLLLLLSERLYGEGAGCYPRKGEETAGWENKVKRQLVGKIRWRDSWMRR